MAEQITLAGETAENERTRPNSHKYCRTCEEWLIPREQRNHDHTLHDAPRGEKRNEEDEEKREKVINKYRVTKIMERRKCVDVYANSESDAISRASDKFREGEGELCGGHDLHTTADRTKTVYSDDEDELEKVPGWPW